MIMSTAQYTLIALLVVVCMVPIVRFEMLCLKDLAQRSDQELSYLTRAGWTTAIAIAIPLGGIFYLSFGRMH